MRTIFEDSEVKSRQLEGQGKKNSNYLDYLLWVVAFAFIAGTWSVYRWSAGRPAPEAPKPPLSLQDPRQTSEAYGNFNKQVQASNWDEAFKLLSIAAQERLKNENKTLRESILGNRKDEVVIEAAATPSIDRNPDYVRQDCIYKFQDGTYILVPLTLIIENDKIVIDSWTEEVRPPDTNKI
jgi:hypothetical protein